MNEQDVINKIKELSTNVHKRTLRGGAEIILLSERVYEAVEDLIHENTILSRFHVVQPSEWGNPPMAPCDIRAIYFGGNVDYERVGDNENIGYGDNIYESFDSQNSDESLSIPNVELGFTEESVSDVIEEYTFN